MCTHWSLLWINKSIKGQNQWKKFNKFWMHYGLISSLVIHKAKNQRWKLKLKAILTMQHLDIIITIRDFTGKLAMHMKASGSKQGNLAYLQTKYWREIDIFSCVSHNKTGSP